MTLSLSRMIRFWTQVDMVLRRWGADTCSLGEAHRWWGRLEPEMAAAAILRARRTTLET